MTLVKVPGERQFITVHNASLFSLVAKTPVPMNIYIDQIVTAGPNNSKNPGTAVIKCDTMDAMVTEDVEALNIMIALADVDHKFLSFRSAVMKNKTGEPQQILVRASAIVADFVSPTADYTVLNTIIGPTQVLKP